MAVGSGINRRRWKRQRRFRYGLSGVSGWTGDPTQGHRHSGDAFGNLLQGAVDTVTVVGYPVDFVGEKCHG